VGSSAVHPDPTFRATVYDPQEATFNTNVDPQKKDRCIKRIVHGTPNITTAKVAENEIIWT